MIPCRALLFDMDGLMVDSEPLWYELQSAFVRARGGQWTPELASRCAGGGLVNALRVVAETFGYEIDVERERLAMCDAYIAAAPRLELKPGCEALVDAARARGIPCAVASSSTRQLVLATLDRFGLRDRFDAVVSGDCVARPKPAPDIFVEAAARLRTAAADCVVLEDALNGVRAAHAAGMRVIAVPERARDAFTGEADFVVSDLDEAARVLFG